MKTKYTKGEWKLQKTTTADKLILSHTDCVIIDCNHHYIKPAVAFGKDKEEAESNAKLIAAAPELLETLKEIEEYINKMGTVSMAMNNIKIKAKSAIKKATE